VKQIQVAMERVVPGHEPAAKGWQRVGQRLRHATRQTTHECVGCGTVVLPHAVFGVAGKVMHLLRVDVEVVEHYGHDSRLERLVVALDDAVRPMRLRRRRQGHNVVALGEDPPEGVVMLRPRLGEDGTRRPVVHDPTEKKSTNDSWRLLIVKRDCVKEAGAQVHNVESSPDRGHLSQVDRSRVISEASSGDPFVFSTLSQPRCMEWMALVSLMVTIWAI